MKKQPLPGVVDGTRGVAVGGGLKTDVT